jgi:hypothetical protein
MLITNGYLVGENIRKEPSVCAVHLNEPSNEKNRISFI